MSCDVSEYILKEYPRTLDLLFISATGDSITNTHKGYIAELEKLASATTEPKTRNMRSVRDYSNLAGKPLYVEKIELFPLDTTITGGDGQDAAVLTEIYDTRTGNDIYAQSKFRYAMMPVNWQPNFFNFNVLINGSQSIEGLDQPAENNIADLSIGTFLPYCFDVKLELERFRRIELRSRLAQYISGEDKYQNYPVQAQVSLRVKAGY